MERDPKIKHEYRPLQWGERIPFKGKESIEKAFEQGYDVQAGSEVYRLDIEMEKETWWKRLWQKILSWRER